MNSTLNGLINFLQTVTGQDNIDAETDLLESELLDSLTIMDVLVYIEDEHGVQLGFGDINPAVFCTATKIAQLISERSSGQAEAA